MNQLPTRQPGSATHPTDNLPAHIPGLTFHGLRHSHKTWLIADHIPEIAQARRLGHHLANRLAEVYSHVAPEIETELLDPGIRFPCTENHLTDYQELST